MIGIEEQLVILTKQTLDTFLKSDCPADLISLYVFYYYTAKWQKTNKVKCATGYVAEGLKWSEAKVRKNKNELIKLGLVEDVTARDSSKKITGHYVKLNYVFSKESEDKIHPNDFAECGNNHSMEIKHPNALSTNNSNALSAFKLNTLANHDNFFEQMWKRYPRKLGKGSVTKKAKQEIFDNKADFEKALENFLRYLEVNQTDEQYIPYGSTFFNTLWRDFVDYEAKAATPKKAKSSYDNFLTDNWYNEATDTGNADLFGED